MTRELWGACACACACVFVSCSKKEPASEANATQQKAEAFCAQIYEAPKRHLEAQCGKDEKQGKPYAELVKLAEQPVKACVAMVQPGLEAGRLTLHQDHAAACAAALEKASYKTTLRTRDLSGFKECSGLASGAQTEGGACRLSLECADGLWCAGATFEADGKCKKRGGAGTECQAPGAWLFDEPQASCTAGSHCNYGGFVGPYAQGFARRLPATMVNKGSEPGTPEWQKRALAEAAEMGVIGLREADNGPEVASPWGDYLPPAPEPKGLGLAGFGEGASQNAKVKPEEAKVDEVAGEGKLPREIIQRIVRQNFGRFRLCYEQGLKKDPKLKGRVATRFVIAKDGSVSSATNAGSDLPAPEVIACVVKAFTGLSFPQPEGGTVTVVYPFNFSPDDAAEASAQRPPGTDPTKASQPDSSSAPIASGGPPASLPPRPAADAALHCIGNLSQGTACLESHHCSDGLVCRNSRCDKPGGPNDICDADLQCAAGHYCAPNAKSGAGKCAPLGVDGASCDHSSQCQGVCDGDTCKSFCSG